MVYKYVTHTPFTCFHVLFCILWDIMHRYEGWGGVEMEFNFVKGDSQILK